MRGAAAHVLVHTELRDTTSADDADDGSASTASPEHHTATAAVVLTRPVRALSKTAASAPRHVHSAPTAADCGEQNAAATSRSRDITPLDAPPAPTTADVNTGTTREKQHTQRRTLRATRSGHKALIRTIHKWVCAHSDSGSADGEKRNKKMVEVL